MIGVRKKWCFCKLLLVADECSVQLRDNVCVFFRGSSDEIEVDLTGDEVVLYTEMGLTKVKFYVAPLDVFCARAARQHDDNLNVMLCRQPVLDLPVWAHEDVL